MPIDGLHVKRRFQNAIAIRENWTWHWQQVADLVMPSRQFTIARSPGQKTNLKIFNDTAPLAAMSLAAALHGLLTNPATRWYSLVMEDFDLSVSEDVRKFLYSATTRGLSYMASPASNFAVAIHESYIDLVSFGTAILQASKDRRGMFRFNARQLANFFMCEDPDGRVDETFRRFELTAQEAMLIFSKDGDVLPDEIKDALQNEKSPTRKWSFVHMVARRNKRNVTRGDGANMPWASVYILEKTGEVIREGGFKRNIYLTPRWSKAPEETFGRSPAIEMLDSIKLINSMERTVIMAAQHAVAPPIVAPANGVEGPIRTAPFSITYTRAGMGQKPEPMFTAGNPRLGNEQIDRVATQIEKAFFLDALKLPELDRMTAEEVITRRQQGLLTASPVISRLNAELLSPCVLRVFEWMRTTRRLGEVPDGLNRARMKVDFRSPMAQSQKASEGGAVLTALQSMVPLITVDPGVMQVIDRDKTARFLWEAGNAPPDLLLSEDEVASLRQQEAQQAALEQQVAIAGGAAAAAKDAAAAGRDVRGS